MAGRKDELFTRGVCLSETLLLGAVLLLAAPMETIANCNFMGNYHKTIKSLDLECECLQNEADFRILEGLGMEKETARETVVLFPQATLKNSKVMTEELTNKDNSKGRMRLHLRLYNVTRNDIANYTCIVTGRDSNTGSVRIKKHFYSLSMNVATTTRAMTKKTPAKPTTSTANLEDVQTAATTVGQDDFFTNTNIYVVAAVSCVVVVVIVLVIVCWIRRGRRRHHLADQEKTFDFDDGQTNTTNRNLIYKPSVRCNGLRHHHHNGDTCDHGACNTWNSSGPLVTGQNVANPAPSSRLPREQPPAEGTRGDLTGRRGDEGPLLPVQKAGQGEDARRGRERSTDNEDGGKTRRKRKLALDNPRRPRPRDDAQFATSTGCHLTPPAVSRSDDTLDSREPRNADFPRSRRRYSFPRHGTEDLYDSEDVAADPSRDYGHDAEHWLSRRSFSYPDDSCDDGFAAAALSRCYGNDAEHGYPPRSSSRHFARRHPRQGPLHARQPPPLDRNRNRSPPWPSTTNRRCPPAAYLWSDCEEDVFQTTPLVAPIGQRQRRVQVDLHGVVPQRQRAARSSEDGPPPGGPPYREGPGSRNHTQEYRYPVQSLPSRRRRHNTSPTPRDHYDTSPTPRDHYDTSPTPRHHYDTSPAPRQDYDTSPTPRHHYDTSPTPRHHYDKSPTPRHHYDTSSTPRHHRDRSPSPRRHCNTTSMPRSRSAGRSAYHYRSYQSDSETGPYGVRRHHDTNDDHLPQQYVDERQQRRRTKRRGRSSSRTAEESLADSEAEGPREGSERAPRGRADRALTSAPTPRANRELPEPASPAGSEAERGLNLLSRESLAGFRHRGTPATPLNVPLPSLDTPRSSSVPDDPERRGQRREEDRRQPPGGNGGDGAGGTRGVQGDGGRPKPSGGGRQITPVIASDSSPDTPPSSVSNNGFDANANANANAKVAATPRGQRSEGRATHEPDREINLRDIKTDNETRRKRPVSVKTPNDRLPVACAADTADNSPQGGGAGGGRRGAGLQHKDSCSSKASRPRGGGGNGREAGREREREREVGWAGTDPWAEQMGVDIMSSAEQSLGGQCSLYTVHDHNTSVKTPYPQRE